MRAQEFLPLFLAIVAASAFASADGEGLVRTGADGTTYLYTTDTLKRDQQVQMQYPKENGDLACCVATSSDGNSVPQTDVTDELNGSDVHMYKLKRRFEKPFYGIAVAGNGAAVTQTASGLEIKDRQTLVKTCLSQEGFHLYSSKAGSLKTHLYFPLGYDVIPTCDVSKN